MDDFYRKFWSMCKNLGVLAQMADTGYLLDDNHFTEKAIPWIKEENMVDDQFIEEYRSLFHKNNIKISGKTGDYISVKKNMYNFIVLFGFSKETILRAAKAYINDNRNSPTYIMEAQYFISKKDNNKNTMYKLAGYCEEETGEETEWREREL